MRIALLAATALVALSPLTLAVAQNELPATRVTGAKPKPKPISVPVYVPVASNGNLDANANTIYPNTVIDPGTPKVRAGDWNAPGAVNLRHMNDRQFAEFQRMHPTAVIKDRCYVGQDPDPNIRAQMNGALGRGGVDCTGGG